MDSCLGQRVKKQAWHVGYGRKVIRFLPVIRMSEGADREATDLSCGCLQNLESG
jgi:hypothetical protein